LGKAFPQTRVRQSIGGNRIAAVADHSAIVVATPGAEPPAEGGYAGAVLLDTPLLLLRQDLRAAEEALRRWLNVVALVRSGADGGSVIAVGESAGRALQALVRVDPAGFAARELGERAAARFPPAAKLITIEGSALALEEFASLLHAPSNAEFLGPVDRATGNESEPTVLQLTLRAPLAEGAQLVSAVKEAAAVRTARKSEGPLRIRVDPLDLS
jgi:primosomal protein N' (replication factor Y)